MKEAGSVPAFSCVRTFSKTSLTWCRCERKGSLYTDFFALNVTFRHLPSENNLPSR